MVSECWERKQRGKTPETVVVSEGETKLKQAHLSELSSKSGRAVGGKTGAGQVCVPVMYPGVLQHRTQRWREETHKASALVLLGNKME